MKNYRKRSNSPPAPSIPISYYIDNPSLWRRYGYRTCRDSQALASVLRQINENGWVLVTVTQYRRTYTVFFKRFPGCPKKDDE